MDPIEKAKSQMGAVQRTFSGLPGIREYREKEMRRDADKKVRVRFAEELTTRRDRITSLQHDLLSTGGLLWMDDMERVVGRIQLLIDRVRTARYGYSGFFDLEQVREPELDRLMRFDQALFEGLAPLDQAIDGLQQAVQANDDNVKGAIQTVAGQLAQMNDQFGKRMAAIQEE